MNRPVFCIYGEVNEYTKSGYVIYQTHQVNTAVPSSYWNEATWIRTKTAILKIMSNFHVLCMHIAALFLLGLYLGVFLEIHLLFHE
jgi:hypothetical protein